MRRALLFLAGLGLLGAAAPAGEGPEAGGGIEVGEESVLLGDRAEEGAQIRPDVAFGEGLYLVVWREGWDGKGGDARIVAARVSPEGKVLGEGIEIAPSKKGVQTRPRVAFGRGVFLVVWQDFRSGKDYDVLAARVSPEGKRLDKEPIAVAAEARSQVLPDVASDGNAFLVVWQGLQGEGTGYRGFAAPVSADGRVGPAVETGASPQPRLAWGGEKYLAAYGGGSTYSVLLSAEGKPLNRSQWGNEIIRSSKRACFSLAGAPGKGWLVLGNRNPPDPWGWGGPGAAICGLVLPDGKTDPALVPHQKQDRGGNWSKLPHWLDLGGKKRTTWPMGESSVAWDGKHFVAVWQRHHIAGEKKSSFANCEIMAARVDGWKPVDPEGVAVAASPEEERHPALASDGAGKLLCVYERHGGDGKVRVCARTLRTY